MKSGKTLAVLLLALAAAPLAVASQTQFWQTGTFEDFLGGKLTGVSLSKEGELRLAPKAEMVFDPEQALALSIAAGPDHSLYIGTGHEGKVFRVDAQGHGSMIFQAPEPEILALAVGPDGAVYAASSPEGKIYRITRDGKSSVFSDPKAKYIWALAFNPRGDLYAGTGDHGLILRIDSSGKSQVFFDSRQTHIMCLAFERDGTLLAGSEPNGLIYRINSETKQEAALGAQAKAFVLYQSNLPEIHSLAVDGQGRIYAAALGGAGGKGTPQFFAPPGAPGAVPVAPETITVVASAGDMPTPPLERTPAQAPGAPPAQQPQQPKSPSFNHPAAVGAPFPLSQMPQGRGALVRILPDSSAETLWSSDRESIFGLALRGRDVLFSTDSAGRIFSLAPTPDGPSLTLLTETRQSLATRLLLDGHDLYVTTSNIAKLFRVEAGASSEGSYESTVKDARFISRWGVLAWRAESPDGSSLQFYTRAGNSERPDSTWSDWAGPYTQSDSSPIKSPPARYIQWKAEFRGSNGSTPSLDDVTLSYLNENLPPEIRYLNISTAGARTGPSGLLSPSPSGLSGSPGMSGGAPNPFGVPSSANDTITKSPTVISWQADDPNGDTLRYALYLKSEREQDWHLLKRNLKETSYQLETDSLADGEYEARLVASDEASNPPGTARRAELLSAPFWIDNFPPRIRVVSQKLVGEGAEIHFEAETKASPLRRAQVETDTGEWRDVQSDDGIVDSRLETFTVKLGKLTPGEHVVSLRAYDTAGNVGVESAVVRVP
ncbi:MAG TPA: hypothetical protein VGW33_06440 [Terriglobia bacterium]|nr:hypothetical protein [Terriglobia bacterium]